MKGTERVVSDRVPLGFYHAYLFRENFTILHQKI